ITGETAAHRNQQQNAAYRKPGEQYFAAEVTENTHFNIPINVRSDSARRDTTVQFIFCIGRRAFIPAPALGDGQVFRPTVAGAASYICRNDSNPRSGSQVPREARCAKVWHYHAQKHFCAACLARDRKSTRLNSSHVKISYAVFCL